MLRPSHHHTTPSSPAAAASPDRSATGRRGRSLGRAFKWLRRFRRTASASPRTIDRHLLGLEDHVHVLAGQAREIETTFVAVGRSLHAQADLGAELTRQSGELLRVAGDAGQGSTLHAARDLVRDSLRFLDRCHAETATLESQLRTFHEQIGGLQNSTTQLERVISPLRIIETLFRIEAVQLPPELQGTFSSVTQQISELDQKVRATFAQQADALDAMRHSIAQACERFAEQNLAQDEAAQARREAVEASLARLDVEIEACRTRHHNLDTLSRAIERDTSAVIVGLQYQDITRQKIEHVIAGLRDLRNQAGDRTPTPSIAFIHQASRLEALQLEAVEGEIGQATAAIGTGARDILQRLERVADDGLGAAALRDAAATLETMIAALLDAMGRTQGLVTDVLRSTETAFQSVRSVRTIASDVTTTIGELAWGIRLIALNAEVQAAQLQTCAGLGVLAKNTYHISEDTARFTTDIGLSLHQVMRQLEEFSRHCQTLTGNARAEQQRLAGHARELERRLIQDRDNSRSALEHIAQSLEQTRTHSADVVNRVQPPLAAANFTRVRVALGELTALAEADDAHRQPLAPEELAAHGRRYTMDSERAIHAQVTQPRASAPASKTATPWSPGAERSPRPAARSEPAADPKSLSASPVATTDVPAPAAAATNAGDAFGDNVELF